jgi:hypothetical protein
MALFLFRVQNVATRSELRRINAMHPVQKIKPDSSGLDRATQRRRVCAANEFLRGGNARAKTVFCRTLVSQ